MLNLLRLILATWRLTSLLVQEDGPYRVFARIREQAAALDSDENHIGGILSCVWCCSIWTAFLVLILGRIAPVVVDILALSAGAILYDKHAR